MSRMCFFYAVWGGKDRGGGGEGGGSEDDEEGGAEGTGCDGSEPDGNRRFREILTICFIQVQVCFHVNFSALTSSSKRSLTINGWN
jgi:hypothetical protein